MNQRKTNNVLWYSLVLALLLCIGFLVISTGTTLARYRDEQHKEISFTVREPEQICLGTVRTVTAEEAATGDLTEDTQIFDPETTPTWESGSELHTLELAVANGRSQSDYSKRDQKVRLRLITMWMGDRIPDVKLRLPDPENPENVVEIKATVTEIAQGTGLYETNGPGWIYRFEQDDGEVSWTLEGGKLSFVSITVVMNNISLDNPSLLQPQIIADVIRE